MQITDCWFHLFTRDRSLSGGSGLIDVNLTTLFSDWSILQEENSSCNFGVLQVIKVVRTGVYYHQTGNEKRTTFRKSSHSLDCKEDKVAHEPRRPTWPELIGNLVSVA